MYSHLQVAGNTIRLMFFIYFSSDLNTIQPRILARKLLDMNMPSSYVLWIFGYLTIACHYVSRERIRPPIVRKNTGALQGTVLALCMYTQNTDNAYPLVKYADEV